jgi:carboxymethylenebutenolidase
MIVLVEKTSDVLIHPGGVPSQLCKWAEEGFTVAQVEASAWASGKTPLEDAVAALKACDKYEDTGKVGLVAYDVKSWNNAAGSLVSDISAAVIYADETEKSSIASSTVPALRHLAGAQPADQPPSSRTKELTTYNYPTAKSQAFATPASTDWNYSLEAVSHTRSLQFLKPILGGPYFDLEYIWDGKQ